MFDDGYKPCGDQPTTIEIGECVAAKTKVADQRLNRAYAALQRAIDPEQRGPLLKAQRLWIQYRDANCGFYGAQQGTISRIKYPECMRVMTLNRAEELEQAAQP